jgi:hypothetical protein
MTLRELIVMFKSMDPVMSKKEQELREKSFFRERVKIKKTSLKFITFQKYISKIF